MGFLNSQGLAKTVSKLKTLIDAAKASAESNLQSSVEALNKSINTKVEKVDGKDLISTSEVEKLAKINLNESGVISVDNLPDTAFERCVTVVSDEARFALTTNDVQNGDTVRVAPEDDSKPPIMYIVVDSSKLNSEEGYSEYRAVTDWSTVRNIPEKISNPTTLDIKINGVSVATYTGNESETVVADINADNIGLEVISDEEIDALFADDSTGDETE